MESITPAAVWIFGLRSGQIQLSAVQIYW